MIENIYILLLTYTVSISLKTSASLHSRKLPCPLSRFPLSQSKILLPILSSSINSSILSCQILWSLQHVIMMSETLLNRLSKRFRRQRQRPLKTPKALSTVTRAAGNCLLKNFWLSVRFTLKLYGLTCHLVEGYTLSLSIRGFIQYLSTILADLPRISSLSAFRYNVELLSILASFKLPGYPVAMSKKRKLYPTTPCVLWYTFTSENNSPLYSQYPDK